MSLEDLFRPFVVNKNVMNEISDLVCVSPPPGDVVPVGGTREGERGPVALVPGDLFKEVMSGKPVHVGSGYFVGGEVLPSAGGFQGYLDSVAMACEARMLDTVRQYMEACGSMYTLVLSWLSWTVFC